MSDPAHPSAVAPAVRSLFVRGLVGAVVGAALGYWLYFALLRHGIVALPLPGASIGVLRDLATRHRSWALGWICAALALAEQMYIVHSSFANGFSNMEAIFWAAFLAGVAFAFWFGIGKDLPPKENSKE